MATEVFLARHGVTEWNKEKRIQGQTDIPLSPDGIGEARKLGKQIENLGVTIIASSPLLRAIETSKIVSAHLKFLLLVMMDFKNVRMVNLRVDYLMKLMRSLKRTMLR